MSLHSAGLEDARRQIEVATFLAAQELMTKRAAKTGRERHRSDLDVAAANPHSNTKNIYKLRSYVRCGPCQRLM